jgi:hypothetical protein
MAPFTGQHRRFRKTRQRTDRMLIALAQVSGVDQTNAGRHENQGLPAIDRGSTLEVVANLPHHLCGLCRVKRVRPPHTARRDHAPHHIVPARPH